ncbi:uncharacterized protein LOC119953538 [Scyliorhinus canicula]|uniref:uncharacterized protein LOC119953538 n=1 Tax=Scyliorhinus canicula TaxID=7830 RepID=UPI0018F5C846|nr:uncharacterized protein LOC119953538 [Scyliorhinus canicula]
MATWVEGKPAPTSTNTLSDVDDIVNETRLPWTRINTLSGVSNKALEPTAPVSPHIFDNEGKLNLGSGTKPGTGPKPRLTPKPFSLEKLPVPYTSLGTTQAPTASKPISVTSMLTPLGKHAIDTDDTKARFRDTEANRAPSGIVLSTSPSFAQKSSVGSVSISWMRAGHCQDGETSLDLHSTLKQSNVAAPSSTTTLSPEKSTEGKSENSETKQTTVIIMETSVQKLKSKKFSEGLKDIGKGRDSSEDPELRGTMQPLKLSKPSVHSRKYSRSAPQGFGMTDSASLSRASSLGFLGKLDKITEKDNNKIDQEKDSTKNPSSLRVQLRRPRPLSAWLPGTTDVQKSESPSEITIKHDEKPSALGKPWLTKPRPLSMDLTARFEVSAHKRNIPQSEDSKENVPITIKDVNALPSDTRHVAVVEQAESAAVTAKCSSSASPNDHEDETNGYFSAAKKTLDESPKMEISEKNGSALTLCARDNKEKTTSPERMILWENNVKNTKITAVQGEEEKEEKISTTSLRSEKEKVGTDRGQLKIWTNKELGKECSDLDRTSDVENSSLVSDDQENKVSGGIIKRRISLLLVSASSNAAKTDCSQPANETEKINVPVRQRIKSFTSENSDTKREQLLSSQRRSFQPRPLSSDITKRFETRTIDDEDHHEKQMDMAASSSPEHLILQDIKEQGGRENLEKENKDKMDMTKNEQLHLMDAATEFRWRRHQSKNVIKALDNLATDEKTHSEKISQQTSFNKEEMRRQITNTSVSVGVASMTRVGTESSDGQKAATDSDLCITAVRVSVVENEVQLHTVPESSHSEDPSYPCLSKGRRSEQTSHSGLMNDTTMEPTAEVMHSEKGTKDSKPLELDAAISERRRKTYFKSEEQNISRSSVNTPPASKGTAQNVSDFLLPPGYGKIGTLQDASEIASSYSPLTVSEDQVTTHHTRKSHSTVDQTKLQANVSDVKRHWNQSLTAEKSSTLEAPSTASKSEGKASELLKTIPNLPPRIEVQTTARVDLDKDGKQQMKIIPLNSYCNTEIFFTSKGNPTDFGLPKGNEATSQGPLTSAEPICVKDSKGNDAVEGHKKAKRLPQGDGTIELIGKVLPKEGREKRRKKIYLEPNPAVSTTDHISDCSTETSYVKRRHTSELLPASDYWTVDRSKDGYPEGNSKCHPKFLMPNKPKTTLLSDEFLDMPWTNREDEVSEEKDATPTMKQPKMTGSDKTRNRKGIAHRNRHSILDLDSLMADYIKEISKRNEESKSSHYHDKIDNHHSDVWKKDDEENLSNQTIESADQGLRISSSSGKSKDTSEMMNRKHLYHNPVLDLDALMTQYAREMPERANIPMTISSKLAGGIFPTVKIQKSSSFASREAKSYRKSSHLKERGGEEFKRDTCESAPADVKSRFKDEKRKSQPSSICNENNDLVKCDLRLNDQKPDGKRIHEVDTSTSTPANLNRRSKHDKKVSRPFSINTEHGNLERLELHTDGQQSANREKGKPREDDHSELRPRHRRNRGEERRSKITPVETDSSTQGFDGQCPDGKTRPLDHLTSFRRSVHGSPQFVFEKENQVEMSVDNRLSTRVEQRSTGLREEAGQKSPLKGLNQFSPEPKTPRPLESRRQIQKAVDDVFMSLEGTSNSRSHEGGKRYSMGEGQSRVTDTLVHAVRSMAGNKTDSQCVEREPDLPSKVQRKIGNVIPVTSKTKKQNEKKVHSRSTVQQEKSQDHRPDRVKQCCIGPSAKAKDTDDLIQESGQFCNCEERDQYGTYEERSSSTNDEVDPCDTRQEHKYSKHEIYRPVSPCKEPSTIPAACPRKEYVQSRVSMSSQSELTPTSEHHLSFFQDPRSINYGLSSFELESPDDTDSLQSTDPGTQVGPTPHGFSFLEPVSMLDSGAQKSRIQLRKKTIRRAPTKHKKGSGDQTESMFPVFPMGEDSWMYKDSTESKPSVGSLVDEGPSRTQKLKITPCSKVAMFPGMDPSVLKASLRRNRQEEEDDDDESSCEQRCNSCTPSSAQHELRMISTTTSRVEGSEEMPPPWLQELKSKKRLSQHHPDRKNE